MPEALPELLPSYWNFVYNFVIKSTWELVKLVGFFFGICTKESVSLMIFPDEYHLWLDKTWKKQPTLSDWKHQKPNAMLWSKKASVQQISRCLIPQSYNRRLVGTIHSNTVCSPKVSGTKNAGAKKPKIASYFRAAFLLTTPFLGTNEMFGAKSPCGHSLMNLKIQHAENSCNETTKKISLRDTQGM